MSGRLIDGPPPPYLRSCPAGPEGAAKIVNGASFEARDPTPDVPYVVGIAPTGNRKGPFHVAQRREGVVEPREEPGVVDDLDGIDRQFTHQIRQGPGSAGADVHGMARVSRDREPVLGMDPLDRVEGRQPGGDGLLQEQPKEMAVLRADLLADDDLDPELGLGSATSAPRISS